MKALRLFWILVILVFYLPAYSQIKISPFVSSGILNHLGRNGINTELGLGVELFKRIDISAAYRQSSANSIHENKVEINSMSVFVSFIPYNRNGNRLLVGPGINYGKYLRYHENMVFEKEYTQKSFNYFKLQFDHTFKSKVKVGAIATLYGDDGDGSAYLGILVGYTL